MHPSSSPEIVPTPATNPVGYRVGVTGHRLHRLDRADLPLLRRRIREALETVRRAAGGETAVRLVSSLAEGADRLVAAAALALGFDLQCPLPFALEEYERDFPDASSAAELRALAARASAVLELNGSRESGGAAYESAGRVTLGHCDLLLAVWDGEPAQGAGGTGQTVGEAAARGVPVFWIHSVAPHTCTLMMQGKSVSSDAWKELAAIVAGQLAVSGGGTEVPHNIEECYAEADRRACRYALLYRLVFRLNCTFSAAAVLCALLTYYEPHAHGWTTAELLLMLFVAFSVWLGTRCRWHDQWLSFRALAEHARMLRFLAPMAATLPRSAWSSDQRSSGHERAAFRAQVRRLAAAAGLPNARITPAYVEACRARLAAELRGQIEYHSRTARRARRINEILERLSIALFILTLAACILHLKTGNSVFTLASAFLPAAGAALAAVVMHGEFARVAQRSEATAERLKELAGRCGGCMSFEEVGALARDGAEALLAELQDWSVLFRARPLSLPN